MIVLGLDTTGAECSVSIVDEAMVRAHISRNIGRGHAEILAVQVEETLGTAKLTPQDIDCVAVCTGPGNFTGLRVAISFAKGFALPRGLPIIGIDALHLTSWFDQPEGNQMIGVYRDVRRGEVFYGEFQGDEINWEPHVTQLNDAKAANRELQLKFLEARVDTRILAWLAMDLDPADYPAEPLYARAPDAKLPGGKSLPKR